MPAVTGLSNLVAAPGFQFQSSLGIAPNKQTRLVIRVNGGPIGIVQGTVYDQFNTPRSWVGFLPDSPFSTGNAGGEAVWDFSTNGCSHGHVKWQVNVMASAANLGRYQVIEEIWQDAQLVHSASISGTLPAGRLVDAFVNGVLIS